MNWGWKITLIYGGFVVMMLTLVILCVQQEVFLVTEDYYEKDLSYNEHIERLGNTASLTHDVTHQYTAKEGSVTLTFPNNFKEIKGEVLAFRPSQTGIDFTVPITVNEAGQFSFSTTEMLNGLWKLKINWEGDAVPYYKEVVLVVANSSETLSKR